MQVHDASLRADEIT